MQEPKEEISGCFLILLNDQKKRLREINKTKCEKSGCSPCCYLKKYKK